MTRSGTGWPETSKKYRMTAVQLLTEQYDAIPEDIPVSQYVREALEERLLREVPEYGKQHADGSGDVRGTEPADTAGAAESGD